MGSVGLYKALKDGSCHFVALHDGALPHERYAIRWRPVSTFLFQPLVHAKLHAGCRRQEQHTEPLGTMQSTVCCSCFMRAAGGRNSTPSFAWFQVAAAATQSCRVDDSKMSNTKSGSVGIGDNNIDEPVRIQDDEEDAVVDVVVAMVTMSLLSSWLMSSSLSVSWPSSRSTRGSDFGSFSSL